MSINSYFLNLHVHEQFEKLQLQRKRYAVCCSFLMGCIFPLETFLESLLELQILLGFLKAPEKV